MDTNKIWHSKIGDYTIPDELLYKSRFRKDGCLDGRSKERNKEIIEWVKKLDAETIRHL